MHKRFRTLLILILLSVVFASCAPPPGAGGAGDGVGNEVNFPRFVIETVWFLLMCIFVYFMMVTRPRELKETERKKFLKDISKGEKVMVNSSIFGKFVSQDDGIVTVEIAPNTKIKVKEESVAAVRETADKPAEKKSE